MRLLRLKRTYGFLLLPLALLLVRLASSRPDLTERFYSTGIYPLMAGLFGRIFSLVPFSVAQWLVILLPLLLIAYIIRQIIRMRWEPQKHKDHLARLAGTLLCLTGVVYFLFIAFCGLNYHRESFAMYSGLNVRPSLPQELSDLCTELAQEANGLRELVAEDENALMASSFSSRYDEARFAQEAYSEVGIQYPILGGYTPRPKPVMFSRAMSWMDITGVFTPFTFECNVNVDTPDYLIPCTMMHELAHFKGFMREDEANFISYLACDASGNTDFDYSGTMLALVHSTNALYSADKDLYSAVMDSLSPAVKEDLAANNAYWAQFEGPVSEVASAVNDVYLKSNHQSGGVRSYGRMVDLLLADYRQRHGLS